MKIHYLQHVSFEDLGSIEPVLNGRGHTITSTKFFNNDALPAVDSLDMLIVLGGPMSVNDENIYSWLNKEKRFVLEAIKSGKKVLGICLGAQIIAEVLGSKIYKNQHREIGWFEIDGSPDIESAVFSQSIPRRFEAFHWHGETFDIPPGAKEFGSSEACKNQGFILNDRVIGLQFHLETTIELAKSLVLNCKDELDDSQYVQSAEKMLVDYNRFHEINKLMKVILYSMID